MGRKSTGRRERGAAWAPAQGVNRRSVLWVLGAGTLAAGGGWYLWASAGSARAGNHPEPPPGAPLPVTLAPALFVGKAAAAYQVAREIPQTLARIYCYCRCDKTVGHTSLMSCFSDDHAAG